MAIPAIIDQLDEVPEELRSHYIETEDGRFMLDADGVEDVSGLKSALEKERAARKALKAELDALSPAAEVAGDDDDARNDDTGDAPAEPEPTSGAESEPEIERSPDQEVAAALRRQLEARLIEAEATAAIVAASGVPELLLPVLLPKLAVHEDAGAFEVRVIASGDGQEGGRDLTDLVDALRRSEIYGRAFDGVGKSGSGAPADSAGSGGAVSMPAGDPLALGRHLADIAAGRVTVEG